MRRRLGDVAIAILALAIAAQPAWAQRRPPDHPVFGHTLMQGSGFITTPHAFVSQGALFATGTAIFPDAFDPSDPYTVTRATGGIALGGWIEVGGTIHTQDAFSAFGKLQVIQQRDIFPAIAVGVMNITTTENGRFGIEDPFYDDIWDAASIYGVATYVAGPGGRKFPSWVVLSVGWGSGIFEEANPQIETGDRSAGLFGAVALDFQMVEDAIIRVVWEWDGFDANVGVTAFLEGLEVTVGALSIEEGDPPPTPQPVGEPFDPTRTFAGSFYNQVKPFVSVTVDLRAIGALPWIWEGDEED